MIGVCHYCEGEGGFEVDTGAMEPWGSFISTWAECEPCGGTGMTKLIEGQNDRDQAADLLHDLVLAGSLIMMAGKNLSESEVKNRALAFATEFSRRSKLANVIELDDEDSVPDGEPKVRRKKGRH